MADEVQGMLDILRHNRGFSGHERWLDYALRHGFKHVEAWTLEGCPDCASCSYRKLGQYIYYSTLIGLRICSDCGLVYSDTHIDPALVATHFETAYKDEDYFLFDRHRIFDEIATLTDRLAPKNGRVLDVGGAKGHLLGMLKQRRPDLDLVVNDLSRSACEWVESHYGAKTICGPIGAWDRFDDNFDVVIMSDVIYYETHLNNLWRLLQALVKKGGDVILRVPNKLPLIRAAQWLRKRTASAEELAMQAHIPFFNPEHLYVFTRGYLRRRLRSLGFSHVVALPSELLLKSRRSFTRVLYYYMAKFLWAVSFRTSILTPSFLVVAQRLG